MNYKLFHNNIAFDTNLVMKDWKRRPEMVNGSLKILSKLLVHGSQIT
jgi:hypothetical protein